MLIGQTNCGCFGNFHLSPWYALSLDICCISLLLVFRPKPSLVSSNDSIGIRHYFPGFSVKKLGFVGACLLLIVGISYGIVVATYGSFRGFSAQLAGDTISIEPTSLDFGQEELGTIQDRWVVVHNWSDRPLSVVGGTANCSCLTTQDLPILIPPKESKSIRIQVKFKGSPGYFQYQANLLWSIDNNTISTIYIPFYGWVLAPENAQK